MAEASTIKKDAMQLHSRPAPTPCRRGGGTDDGLAHIIPDICDTTVEKPKAGHMRISSEAAEGRLRRLFTPNIKGEYKVSTEIVQQWRTKKGRKSLEKLFQSCGFNADWWCLKFSSLLLSK